MKFAPSLALLLALGSQKVRYTNGEPKINTDPADFTSSMNVVCSSSGGGQRIGGMMDGQPMLLIAYERTSATPLWVNVPLRLGAYKAKAAPPVPIKGLTPHDVNQVYDLLIDNGVVREYLVIGLGSSSPCGGQ